MADVKKSRRFDGAPVWSLGRWYAEWISYSNGTSRVWFGEPAEGAFSVLHLDTAKECHDLIRVLQEVHNEMRRREANPNTTDRTGWSP